MKSVRRTMILEIIANMDIETQFELAEELRKHGVSITQATVSRDIKELKLVKVLTSSGKYKYAVGERTESEINDKLIRIFAESVLSITAAENIIVIKTLMGSANAAAETIDSLHCPEIVGTLAGDNTIFIVVQHHEQAPQVIERLQALLR